MKLLECIKDQNLSIADVAKHMRISEATLTAKINGEMEFEGYQIHQLSVLLHEDSRNILGWIYGYKEPEPLTSTINNQILDDLETLSGKIGTLSEMIAFANNRAWDMISNEPKAENIQILANLLETLSEVAIQRDKDVEAIIHAITHDAEGSVDT